jgi:hypothetical protein
MIIWPPNYESLPMSGPYLQQQKSKKQSHIRSWLKKCPHFRYCLQKAQIYMTVVGRNEPREITCRYTALNDLGRSKLGWSSEHGFSTSSLNTEEQKISIRFRGQDVLKGLIFTQRQSGDKALTWRSMREWLDMLKKGRTGVADSESSYQHIPVPPLWSSGQRSCLQIKRSGFDSRRYQIFWEVAGLERVHSTSWVQLPASVV